MPPSAAEPIHDGAPIGSADSDGLRDFILDQMQGASVLRTGPAVCQGPTFAAQAEAPPDGEEEIISEETERRFVESAMRACAKMTRETQRSRNKLTILHQEFNSTVSIGRYDCALQPDADVPLQDGEWAREHGEWAREQVLRANTLSSEETSVADQLD
jgi:hypothetical protein